MAKYKKNFLTNVIYRLDVDDIEELNDNVKLEAVYDDIINKAKGVEFMIEILLKIP